MKKVSPFPAISLHDHHRQWTQDGVPILQAQAILPHADPSLPHDKAARRFNRFYRQYLRTFFRFCSKELLPRAKADFLAATAQSHPIPMAEVTLCTTVTYAENNLLSLHTDLTAAAFFTRTADTWDLKAGCPLPLWEFFPAGHVPKKELIALARQNAARQIAESAPFYEDYRRILRRDFSSRRFYLTSQGLVFYYQPGSIAPLHHGPISFLLPYSETGPHLPT